MRRVILFLFVIALITAPIFSQQTASSLKPELVLPIGHTKAVSSTIFSPDSKLIVTVSGAPDGDNTAKIWDTQTGKMLRTLNDCQSVAFSSDGKMLVSISSDGAVIIRDVQTGNILRSLNLKTHLGYIESATFSPDSQWIITTNSSGYDSGTKMALVWDIQTGSIVNPQESGVVQLEIPYLNLNTDFAQSNKNYEKVSKKWAKEEGYNFSFIPPAGKFVVTTNVSATTKIRDINSGNIIGSIESINPINISFSPDSRWIIARDSLIRIWDSQKGTLVSETPEFGHEYAPLFSNDGKRAAIQPNDSTFEIWDVQNTKMIHTFSGHTDRIIFAAFSPDGSLFVTSSLDQTARIRDVVTGKIVNILSANSGYFNSLTFSPDGKMVLSRPDEYIYRRTDKLWDVQTGKAIQSFKGLGGSPVFSPDGKKIATIDWPNMAKIWNVQTGNMIHALDGHTMPVKSAIFSPDAKFIVTTSNYETSKIWEIQTGKLVQSIKSDLTFFLSTELSTLSPDSKWIMKRSGDGVKIWDVQTGEMLHTIKGIYGSVGDAKISPDRKWIIVPEDTTVRIWNILTGKIAYSLEGHKRDVYCVSFSPDGIFIASGSSDETYKIWDVQTGKMLYSFGEHKNLQTPMASFSPDSKWVVTISWNEAKIWDCQTGKLIWILKGHKDMIYSSIVSQDGNRIATTSSDRTVKIWDVKTGKMIHNLAGHATGADWTAFSPDGKFIVTYDGYDVRNWDSESGALINRFTIKELYGIDMMNNLIISHNNSRLTLWNLFSGKELLSWVAIDSTDWAVIHPSGLFDASPGAMEKMYFVQGLEIVGLEQLKSRYYEPDLWAKVMGKNKEPLRQVDSLQTLELYPEIKTLPIEGGLLYIDLIDRGGGIGKVIVTINRKEIDLAPENRIVSPDGHKLELTYNLNGHPYLLQGVENEIEVKAYNADNWLISRGIKEKYTLKAPKIITPPNLYAIIVGSSNYRGALLDLGFASKDATDFAGVLGNSSGRLFGAGNTFITLLNTDGDAENYPTRGNLKKAVEGIAAKAQSGDIFIFYLAGHGTNWGGQDGDFYFLTSDASDGNLNDPVVRGSVAVSGSEITQWFKQVAALKQVLIMDVCHSGKLADDLMGARGDVSSSVVRSYERMKDRTGMYILAGSAADAVSYETSVYGQGLLTYSLIFGMKGAALRDGEFVDVMKLFQHSADQVPQLAQGIGGIQRPQVRTPYGGQSFDIGRVTKEDQTNISLKAPRPMFLRSSFQDEVQMDDVLGISEAMDTQMRDLSNRGGETNLVFIDASRFSEAYKVTGRYSSVQGQITANIVLRKGDVQVSRFTVDALSTEELIRKTVEEVMKVAKR
jgi:WD40 repeat protein